MMWMTACVHGNPHFKPRSLPKTECNIEDCNAAIQKTTSLVVAHELESIFHVCVFTFTVETCNTTSSIGLLERTLQHVLHNQ